MSEKLNEFGGPSPDRLSLVHLKVSAEGEAQIAVAYLRVAAGGAQRVLALVEQQNVIQRFADDASYKVVGWYVEGDGVELNETALSRLMADVVTPGREFNAVLVQDHSRLSRSAVELAEVMRTLREHGVDLVSVANGSHFIALERQLRELNGAVDEEAAD